MAGVTVHNPAVALPPDEQETLFVLEDCAEVRITVRVPGANTEDGEPVRLTYSQVMLPEEVRIQDVRTALPPAIERAAKSLILSMRFR